MMLSFLAAKLQLQYRAPIMFHALTKNGPIGKLWSAATTAMPPSPKSAPPSYSSSLVTPFLQGLGKIVLFSFFGGLALGFLDVAFFRGNYRKSRGGTTTSFVSTAVKIGDKIITFLIFATIVKYRLVPVFFVRSVFVSKQFWYLTFGGGR